MLEWFQVLIFYKHHYTMKENRVKTLLFLMTLEGLSSRVESEKPGSNSLCIRTSLVVQRLRLCTSSEEVHFLVRK